MSVQTLQIEINAANTKVSNRQISSFYFLHVLLTFDVLAAILNDCTQAFPGKIVIRGTKIKELVRMKISSSNKTCDQAYFSLDRYAPGGTLFVVIRFFVQYRAANFAT